MNASAHALGAAIVVGGIHAGWEQETKGSLSAAPLLTAGVASLMGSLPDALEPAIHPNHRQFFHGLMFAVMVGYAVKRTFEWEPQSPAQEICRVVLLCAGGAYLTHLLMDACTKKSIPFIGKI